MVRFFLQRLWTLGLFVGLVFTAFGLVFLGVGLLIGKSQKGLGSWLFATIGGLVLLGGLTTLGKVFWTAWRAVWLLRYGRIVPASVIAISSDQSVKIDGRHPRRLRYLFVLPGSGEKIKGTGPNLSRKEEQRWRVGDQIRIAYHPEDPQISTPIPDEPR